MLANVREPKELGCRALQAESKRGGHQLHHMTWGLAAYVEIRQHLLLLCWGKLGWHMHNRHSGNLLLGHQKPSCDLLAVLK